MSPVRSCPGSDRMPGWRGWVLGLLAAWMIPVWLGLGLLHLADLAVRVAGPGPALFGLGRLGQAMALSMMLSALWLGPTALAAWLLLRLGWGGWLSLAMAGAVAGGLVTLAVPGLTAWTGAGLGALNAMVLWVVFSWIRPEIFTAR